MAIEAPNASSFVREDILPAIAGIFEAHQIDRRQDGTIVMRGYLVQAAEEAYRPLRARFERLGYTPFLQSHRGQVELIAVPFVIHRRPPRVWINFVLFVATLLSVLITGMLYELGGTPPSLTEIVRNPTFLLAGVPFTATLLGILGTHEMGHYVVSRIRKAPASLPYFIPMIPGITITGTLGAVIVQREPFEDRRTLLEVAIAGPLAGLVLAIPLLFYGLATSTVGPTPEGVMYIQEGNSLLYAWAKYLVFGQWLPSNGMDVQLNTVAWAAWIGLLITMFNLLPVGQLDGGHIAYALLGRRADWLAYAVLAGFLVLGIFVSQAWLVWVILIAFMGPRHPPPFNDVTRLKPVHILLGVIGFIMFVLLFTPDPLRIVG
jgi:membrane-associated protease RseP (regulator of RpoE activity)